MWTLLQHIFFQFKVQLSHPVCFKDTDFFNICALPCTLSDNDNFDELVMVGKVEIEFMSSKLTVSFFI